MYKGNKLNYEFGKQAVAMQLAAEKGHKVWQKFTCAKCGSRQTMAESNVCYKTGRCEECDHVTDLVEDGFGLLIYTIGPTTNPFI